VNGEMPSVGAGDYSVAENDVILLYEVGSTKPLIPVVNPVEKGSSQVDLKAVINSSISISLDKSEVDFGTILAGKKSNSSLKVSNSGGVDAKISVEVKGDSVFVDSLKVGDVSWGSYNSVLSVGNNVNLDLSIVAPSVNVVSGGVKGQLIIWTTVN
jgi:hypothetical protein